MGLDAVELVMECEERFGIRIPDEAASRVLTVGELYQVILRLVPHGKSASGSVFYRLRQGFMACGIERQRVLPSARLEDLFPREQRRVLWSALAGATKLRLPELQPAKAMVCLVLGLLFLSLAAIPVSIASRRPGPLVLLISAAVVGWILRRLFHRPGVELPDNCQTVQDLVYAVIGRNAALFNKEGGLTEREVWRMLRGIIAEQLGVAEDQIKPETRFVEDLHI